MHILLAEDDQRMARAVARGLEQEGHVVAVVHDGDAALAAAHDGGFDLLVLDVMMPRRDGFRVVQALRADGVGTPALLLTARGEVEDRVRGLDVGADDYLVKPFAFEELLARVRALGRRQERQAGAVLAAGAVRMDLLRHAVEAEGKGIDLSPTEFRLLELFLRHPGQALSRAQILSRVWGYDAAAETGVVDLYVHYLRRKLGRALRLRTVRGVGYRLERSD